MKKTIHLFLLIAIMCSCFTVTSGCGGGEAKPMKGYQWCWVCKGHQKLSSGEICLTCKGTGTLTDEETEITKKTFEIYQRSHQKNGAEMINEENQYSTSSNSTESFSGYDQYYDTNTRSNVMETTRSRVPCRACHQTGQCSCARGGHPGQMLSHYTSSGEPIYIRCTTCYGTGVCSGCGGDGYLD